MKCYLKFGIYIYDHYAYERYLDQCTSVCVPVCSEPFVWANLKKKTVDRMTWCIDSEIGIHMNSDAVYRVFIVSQKHEGILFVV